MPFLVSTLVNCKLFKKYQVELQGPRVKYERGEEWGWVENMNQKDAMVESRTIHKHVKEKMVFLKYSISKATVKYTYIYICIYIYIYI